MSDQQQHQRDGVRVAVIGAGVIGVGSALAIQQALPEASVTILASHMTPHTTGDGAAGLWGPHLVTGDAQKIAAWGRKTYDLFHHLWLEGDCPGIGLLCGRDEPHVALHNTVPFFHEDVPKPLQPQSQRTAQSQSKSTSQLQSQPTSQSQSQSMPWLRYQSPFQPRPDCDEQVVRNTQRSRQTMTSQSQISLESPVEQSRMASRPSTDKRFNSQVTFFAEPSKLLPFLLSRFLEHGGTTVTCTVTSLDQLADYDVIINCSGLGARQLVPDLSVYPIRGQLVRVRAPFVKSFLLAGDSYIIPNGELTVLGGTGQVGDWRTTPDEADTARILSGCCHLLPALRTAPVVDVWAGLRPAREGGVRLETERRLLCGEERLVVHNYGHGGAGVTLFWGCALEVAALLRQEIHTRKRSSKL